MKNLKDRKFATIEELERHISFLLEKRLVDYGFYTKENAGSIARDMTGAITEDIYMEKLAEELWADNVHEDEAKKMQNEAKRIVSEQKNKYLCVIKKIKEVREEEGCGLAVYTSRYCLGSRFYELMPVDIYFLEKCVGADLYKKIYPVFWIAMLNRDPKDTYNFSKYLLEPIEQRNDREKYIFALLINERKGDEKSSIFTLVKKELSRRFKEKTEILDKHNENKLPTIDDLMKDKKEHSLQWCGMASVAYHMEKDWRCQIHTFNQLHTKEVELLKEIEEGDFPQIRELDMNDLEDRIYFVEVLKEVFQSEEKDGNREKRVFEDNFLTLEHLIKIGNKCGMPSPDPALFLYLTEKLTGWLGFYFYVNLKDGNGECQPYTISERGIPIATFYCWKKSIKEAKTDIGYNGESYNVRKLLMGFIWDILENISDENKKLIQETKNNCRFYHQLYDDIFKKSAIYTRMDALTYYCELFGNNDAVYDDYYDDDDEI